MGFSTHYFWEWKETNRWEQYKTLFVRNYFVLRPSAPRNRDFTVSRLANVIMCPFTTILSVCIYLLNMCVLVAQSCPTLCDCVDCSLPGSSIHRILQASILDWIAIPFSRGSSWPRNQTWVSLPYLRQILYHLSHHHQSPMWFLIYHQKLELKCPPTINDYKQTVVHTYSVKLLSNKKEWTMDKTQHKWISNASHWNTKSKGYILYDALEKT